jgi:hypothetical protein
MSELVTAETITDEQIRELRASARANRNTWLIGICDVASSDLDSDCDVAAYRIECRARCAKIVNATLLATRTGEQ